MRRGVGIFLFSVAAAAFLSGSAGAANSQNYADPVGDAGGGPDITNVAVANDDAGVITHTTSIVGGLPADRYLSVYFDVPPISSNPDDADYLLEVETFAPASFNFYQWTGTMWQPLGTQGMSSTFVTGGFQFVLPRSALGSPAFFYVLARTRFDNYALADSRGWDRFDIVLDVTPPETTITSGPQATTTSTSAGFTYTSSEGGSSFECSLDNAAFTACPASGATYGGLGVGGHNFRVRARDAAGNLDASPATHAWTVQAVTPPPPPVRPFKAKSWWITPKPPVAGKTVVVGVRFAYNDSGGAVPGGTTRCRGRIGAKGLAGKVGRKGGARTCTFRLPKNAAGKLFKGRVTLTATGYQWFTELSNSVVGLKRLNIVGPNTIPKAPVGGQEFRAACPSV